MPANTFLSSTPVRQRIRVAGLVVRDNAVLLVEQISPRTGRRRWSSPGGGLELSDADIFRGMERELFEETGLRVRAGAIRFMSEFYDSDKHVLMIDIWIACYPVQGDTFGEVTNAHQRHDDHIGEVRWWSRDEFLALSPYANAPLLQAAFWDNLHDTSGAVIFLGRWEE